VDLELIQDATSLSAAFAKIGHRKTLVSQGIGPQPSQIINKIRTLHSSSIGGGLVHLIPNFGQTTCLLGDKE
jgi:hypothetical protein